MLIWLASFPRSGSALTRAILWHSFGLQSSSPGGSGDRVTEVIGPPLFPPGTDIEAMIAAADATPDPIVVKTHDRPAALPRQGDPAIVIVRDGRPVMASFTRFMDEVSGRSMPLRRLIRHPRLNWSQHVTDWLDYAGPTLLLHYEDLRVARQETLDAIAGFIGRPQVAPFTLSVEEIRAIRPTHIRVARNEPGIAEVERLHGTLFWEKHGAAMTRLGYAR